MVVSNLVDNALRYGGSGTAVTVRIKTAAEGRIALEVEDEGPGIPADLRKRVLERFFRVPGQTTPGTGLGLAIVKEIASLHGATLALDDARPPGSPPLGLRVTVSFSTTKATGGAPPAA